MRGSALEIVMAMAASMAGSNSLLRNSTSAATPQSAAFNSFNGLSACKAFPVSSLQQAPWQECEFSIISVLPISAV